MSSLWPARSDWWRALQWWRDDDTTASTDDSSLPFSQSIKRRRGRTPSVSSPFNVRRLAYLDVDLRWHGEGGELSAMLELGRKIGRGGFSDVYQARHKETQAMYACKVFRHIPYTLLQGERSSSQQEATLTALIKREIEVLKTTRHENIVSYFGCLASPDTSHLALLMELCDAGSVKDLLLQSTEKLREKHIAYIVRCVLLALQHLHRTGLVHRDVKCANILLTTDVQVKLSDFGVSSKQYIQLDATDSNIASTTSSAASTQSLSTSSPASSSSPSNSTASTPEGTQSIDHFISPTSTTASFIVPPSPSFSTSSSSSPSSLSTTRFHPTQPLGGTPLWMSPESLCGADPADSGDVWALGITCIEMAEGSPPHARLTPNQVRAVVTALDPPSLASDAQSFGVASDEFSSFVSLCLVKDPRERATVAQLLQHPFITQVAADTAAHLASSSSSTLTSSGSSRGAHLAIPLSPRQSPFPTPVASPAPTDHSPCPLPIPVPLRSQSCPSPLPRQPVSPRPRSSNTYHDRDFQHFILYGYYPLDSEWWMDEEAGGEASSQRKHSTPSPVPPVSPSAASAFMSSVTHAASHAWERWRTRSPLPFGPRRKSFQLSPSGSGHVSPSHSPSPAAQPPIRQRQLSVPENVMATASSHSLSPHGGARRSSNSRTPLAQSPAVSPSPVPSPLSSIEPSPHLSFPHDHATLELRLPSLQHRKTMFQHGDRHSREELAEEEKQQRASTSPSSTESEDESASPAAPMRVVVDNAVVYPMTQIRRAQTLDPNTGREAIVLALSASKQPPQPHPSMMKRLHNDAPIRFDLTPTFPIQRGQSSQSDSGVNEALYELIETTTATAPFTPLASSPSPSQSPSPQSSRLGGLSARRDVREPKAREFNFDIQHPAPEGEEDEEAVVVVDLDKIFEDLVIDTTTQHKTEHEPLLSTSSTSSTSTIGTTGAPAAAASRRGSHLPPLIHISTLSKSSTSSVYQLSHDDNIALTPSPRPSLWEDKGEHDRQAHDKASQRRYPRTDSLPVMAIKPWNESSAFYSALPSSSPRLSSTTSSPQLMSSELGQIPYASPSAERSFDPSRFSFAPHPSPSSSTSATPPTASPIMSPNVSTRRPMLTLQLPGIADDEPRSGVSPIPANTSPSAPSVIARACSFRKPSFCSQIQIAAAAEANPVDVVPQHDSYVITDDGTFLTTEFRITPQGVISEPEADEVATARSHSHSHRRSITLGSLIGPTAGNSSPSSAWFGSNTPVYMQQADSGLSPLAAYRLDIPSPMRSISTPMLTTLPHHSTHSSMSPLASPTACSPSVYGHFDLNSPLAPSLPRTASADSVTSPLRVCLRSDDLVEMCDIGTGQHGSVRKALHLPSLTRVALKRMSVFDRDARHQFYKELKTFSKLRSEHLVCFLGAFHDDGHITMGVEYMDCGSLTDFVDKNAVLLTPRAGDVQLPYAMYGLNESLLCHLARQMVLGLNYLHRSHLVHRDIKVRHGTTHRSLPVAPCQSLLLLTTHPPPFCSLV